jgi:hypothetical protein
MVGLDEAESAGGKKTDYYLTIAGLFFQKKYEELTSQINREIEADNDTYLDDLFLFVVKNGNELNESTYRDKLIKIVNQKINKNFAKKSGRAEEYKKIVRLALLGAELTSHLSFSDFLVLNLENKRNYLLKSFQQMSSYIFSSVDNDAKTGCAALLKDPPGDQQYNKFLFCLAWSGRSWPRAKTPGSYFAKHADLLKLINRRMIFAMQDPTVAQVLDSAKAPALVSAMRAEKVNPTEFLLKTSFLDNLATIASSASNKGTRLVLLHYPNLKLEKIDAAGVALKVPVIGDDKLFSEKIQRDGYGAYFTDRIGGSGHMSDIALEIYGNYVAEKLFALMSSR